jgi:hypothetical protein
MNKQDFFFCYDKRLFTFLKDERGIDYITIAKNVKTDIVFSMFYKSPEFHQALTEYKQLHNSWYFRNYAETESWYFKYCAKVLLIFWFFSDTLNHW